MHPATQGRMALVLLLVALAACGHSPRKSERLRQFDYGVSQEVQRAQCAKLIDAAQREQCYRAASLSMKDYDRQRAAL